MPISYDDFKKGNFERRATGDITEHPIYLFLKKNKKYGYKAKEICKELNAKEDNVRHVLYRLVKKKLIEHKQPYFAYKK